MTLFIFLSENIKTGVVRHSLSTSGTDVYKFGISFKFLHINIQSKNKKLIILENFNDDILFGIVIFYFCVYK